MTPAEELFTRLSSMGERSFLQFKVVSAYNGTGYRFIHEQGYCFDVWKEGETYNFKGDWPGYKSVNVKTAMEIFIVARREIQ